MTTSAPLTYAQAGVSVEAGDQFASRIKQLTKSNKQNPLLLPALGGYASVYALDESENAQCVALTTDGVGTKVLLAIEQNNLKTIGQDLVAMCVNDLLCVGAKPTLFLDYYATGKLQPENAFEIIQSINTACLDSGCFLVGGETAEMPDVYQGDHFDLAGFAVGTLTKKTLLTGKAVEPGQTIIGLPSSGIHSNGLSLARKVITNNADRELLLTPTQLYVKPVVSILNNFPGSITGMAHITGGGWRNLLRINSGIGFDITKPLPVPDILKRLQDQGIAQQECYETFNMGLGMALVVQDNADAIVKHLQANNINAQIIGAISANAKQISSPVFQYQE